MNYWVLASLSRFSFKQSLTIKDKYLQNQQLYQRFTQLQIRHMHKKTVLRKIDDRNLNNYLTPTQARLRLRYPSTCQQQAQALLHWDDVVGIGYKSRYERDSSMWYEIVICNKGLETIFRGTSKSQIKANIQSVIKGKVVIGYNLGELFKQLMIQHSTFIDLRHLYPQRQTLRSIALEVLGIILSSEYKYMDPIHDNLRYLEYDSSDEQNRREGRRRRNRNSRENLKAKEFIAATEQASVCVKIAERHINEGRGIITIVETHSKDFKNIEEILLEAEINKQMIIGLFLRGSRALGIEIASGEYYSDWDYVCVLETTATINSVLVKLHNVDLLLMDRKTFLIYVNGGDLPMIQLFSLPPPCILINQFPSPIFSPHNIKRSLAHHLQKSDRKLAYYSALFYENYHPDRHYWKQPQIFERSDDRSERPRRQGSQGRGRRYRYEKLHELEEMQVSRMATNLDPKKVKWKFLKVMHMQVRLLDTYLQIKQHNRIVNPLAKTQFWNKIRTTCETHGQAAAYRFCREEINRLLCQVFTTSQLENFSFNFYKHEDMNQGRRPRRYYEDRRGYNKREEGRRSRKIKIHNEVDQLLSIYRKNIALSSGLPEINRIDDIKNYEDEFSITYWRDNEPFDTRSPAKMVLNIPYNSKLRTSSLFLNLIETNADVSERNLKYLFAPIFIRPCNYFDVRYIQKSTLKLPEDDLATLTNFIPQENANFQLTVVKEATASIIRSHQTEFQSKTTVKTQVCYMYAPFREYSQIKKNHEAVAAIEGAPFDIYEKRDGVLTALYFAGNGWIVGTKQTPDGREHVSSDDSTTISEQFLRIFNALNYSIPLERDRYKVFLFELLSTKIDNTVPKSKDELILHGVRNMKTLQQEDPQQYAQMYAWSAAERIVLSTQHLEKIAQMAESRQNCQGFILRDGDFNRVIFRNSSILKQKWQRKLECILNLPKDHFMSGLIDNNRKAYFIYSQIVLKDKHEAYLQLFPEDRPLIDAILHYINEVNRECRQLQETASDIGWENESQMNELIADKRIDVLTYLRSYCNKSHPELFTNRVQTSINFADAFAFLLQHLANKNIIG